MPEEVSEVKTVVLVGQYREALRWRRERKIDPRNCIFIHDARDCIERLWGRNGEGLGFVYLDTPPNGNAEDLDLLNTMIRHLIRLGAKVLDP